MTDVPGGLISLEYALQGLAFTPRAGSSRDADVIAYIKAATPIIEHLAGPVLPRTATQIRNGGKSAVLVSGALSGPDSVLAVRVDGSDWSGYIVNAPAGIVHAGQYLTFPAGIANVEIDVQTGYNPIPEALQLAARELVRHWVQFGKQSPAPADTGITADPGTLVTDEYAIPRRVRQLCAPFAGGGFA